MEKSRLWVCVAPVALCLLDQSVTLAYQPAQYWAGDYLQAQEACPPFRWLLQSHPLAFEAGVAIWIAAFAVVIFALPRRAARTVALALVIGHTWGASSWIHEFVPAGYWVVIALFIGSAALTVATWDRADRGPTAAASEGTK